MLFSMDMQNFQKISAIIKNFFPNVNDPLNINGSYFFKLLYFKLSH